MAASWTWAKALQNPTGLLKNQVFLGGGGRLCVGGKWLDLFLSEGKKGQDL